MVPITLPSGEQVRLSPGTHNVLQARIVEQFAPLFAAGSRLLYLGDAADKDLVVDTTQLEMLRIPITEHDKLPDVVLYRASDHRLFLVEAVTSHGPVTPKRRLELERVLSSCDATLVWVSVFPHFREFKRHAAAIAWETEVWIAEMPDPFTLAPAYAPM